MKLIERTNEQKYEFMVELLTFSLYVGAAQAAPPAWGNQPSRSQPSNAPPAANRPGLF